MDNKQYDWDNLPTPDEEHSWQKMKALLDKEDDDRVPPPVFFRNCAGWGLFGIAVLIGLWFIIKPVERWSNKQTAAKEKEQTVTSQNESSQQIQKEKVANTNKTTTANTNQSAIGEDQKGQAITTKTKASENNEIEIRKENSNVNTKSSKNNIAKTKPNKNKRITSSKTSITKKIKTKSNESDAVVITDSPLKMPDGYKADDNPAPPTGMYPTDSTKKTSGQDTIHNPLSKQDTTSEKESQPSEENKKKQQRKKQFYLTAGLGVQQQVPIGGQDAFPYNFYGRKGSLSDYIPSAYVRLHKENKWFVQAEFRYGAPQSVKDFSYSRQTVYDTSMQSLTTTSLYLRKTYYHQIPLSFNHYVKPNWSVGVGGVYSRFYGAVTEEEIRSKNVFTQAEKVSRKIVQIAEYNDSFLYKTQVHFLVQTDYQWKRFSFGLRYKKDIQPYIKYTQPDGKVDVKKNQSLEAIIRFRLWQSKKF